MPTSNLWVRVIRRQRIIRQATVPCLREDPREALLNALKELDLAQPLWLDKNQREWEAFGQTRFTPEHFLETVAFDRLEMECIQPDAPRGKSRDPRNEA